MQCCRPAPPRGLSTLPPMKVGIIGLGNVGLPLAVAFAGRGHEVVDLDALVVDFRGVTRGTEAADLVRL
jgi:UDP-N-acetyl-D-mannosaminuronate dehydrogenase